MEASERFKTNTAQWLVGFKNCNLNNHIGGRVRGNVAVIIWHVLIRLYFPLMVISVMSQFIFLLLPKCALLILQSQVPGLFPQALPFHWLPLTPSVSSFQAGCSVTTTDHLGSFMSIGSSPEILHSEVPREEITTNLLSFSEKRKKLLVAAALSAG